MITGSFLDKNEIKHGGAYFSNYARLDGPDIILAGGMEMYTNRNDPSSAFDADLNCELFIIRSDGEVEVVNRIGTKLRDL